MIRFFRIVLVVMLLCVVALLSAVTTMHFAIHGAEVSVPDFRGLSIADATRKAASLDLNLSVDNRFYSTEMPEDRVLTQSPASGTVVRREWRVRVTQSLGPRRAAIPNIIGQEERTATILIRRAGFDLGDIAHIPFSGPTPGSVVAQNPAPDSEGVERPSMSLLIAVSSATKPDGVVMPDLMGQMLTTAASAVAHAGLRMDPVVNAPVGVPPVSSGISSQPPVLPVPPGTVMGQSPAAGHRVDSSTPVQLVIAP